MRPIKNSVVRGFPIKVIRRLSYHPVGTLRFETCWLCHKPIAFVYMCDECWSRSPLEARVSAKEALREALETGSWVIYQFSPTSYKIGG